MELSVKAKNRLALAAILVMFGIVGEMDYRAAVETEQAAIELRAEQAAKWTTYQISR